MGTIVDPARADVIALDVATDCAQHRVALQRRLLKLCAERQPVVLRPAGARLQLRGVRISELRPVLRHARLRRGAGGVPVRTRAADDEHGEQCLQ